MSATGLRPSAVPEAQAALKAPDGFAWCTACDGFGHRMVSNIKAPWFEDKADCPDCDGTGLIAMEDEDADR